MIKYYDIMKVNKEIKFWFYYQNVIKKRQLNVDVTFHCDATTEELIDVLEGNRRYVPCIYILNKVDAISMEELKIYEKMPHYVPISGMLGWNFEELYETIWDYLDFIRVNIFIIK